MGIWQVLGEVKPIQRNAIIALAHFKESAIPELKEVALNDPRPMIRGTAYWAIGQILEDDAISFIDEHYENEIEEVQLEMKKGLQMRREQNDKSYCTISTRNTSKYRKYCTCAGTLTHLHLIKPLSAFSTEDKMLKRAGLDYWEHVNITYHDSIEEFLLIQKVITIY